MVEFFGTEIFFNICREWISFDDVGRIDSALLITSLRPHFFYHFKNTSLKFCEILSIPNTISRKFNVDLFFKWLKNRVGISHPCPTCFVPSAYSFINATIPALKNVVGSVGLELKRSIRTSTQLGSVSNYTALSIQKILYNLMLCPAENVRFLDAGCGNSIFIAVTQVCFPEAKVVRKNFITKRNLNGLCVYLFHPFSRFTNIDFCR